MASDVSAAGWAFLEIIHRSRGAVEFLAGRRGSAHESGVLARHEAVVAETEMPAGEEGDGLSFLAADQTVQPALQLLREERVLPLVQLPESVVQESDELAALAGRLDLVELSLVSFVGDHFPLQLDHLLLEGVRECLCLGQGVELDVVLLEELLVLLVRLVQSLGLSGA